MFVVERTFQQAIVADVVVVVVPLTQNVKRRGACGDAITTTN